MVRKAAFSPGSSFRLKYHNFRNACFRHIKQTGPQTANQLIENVRNCRGEKFGQSIPKNSASLSAVLLRDKRFIVDSHVRSRNVLSYAKEGRSSHDVILWGVADDEV